MTTISIDDVHELSRHQEARNFRRSESQRSNSSKGTRITTASRMSNIEIDELLEAEHQNKSTAETADAFYALMNGESTGSENAVDAAYALMNGEMVDSSSPEFLEEDNYLEVDEADGISVVSALTTDSDSRARRKARRRRSTEYRGRRSSLGASSISTSGSDDSWRKRMVGDSGEGFADFDPESELFSAPTSIVSGNTPSQVAGSVGSLARSRNTNTSRSSVKDEVVGKIIAFGDVNVRYYDRVIDINPSTSSGISLGLGWNYNKSKAVPVEEFELQRGGVRYKAQQLVMPRYIREDIAKEFGFTQKEIAEGTRVNLRYKNERKQTIDNLSMSKVEEKVEMATRKVSKLISFGGRSRRS